MYLLIYCHPKRKHPKSIFEMFELPGMCASPLYLLSSEFESSTISETPPKPENTFRLQKFNFNQ